MTNSRSTLLLLLAAIAIAGCGPDKSGQAEPGFEANTLAAMGVGPLSQDVFNVVDINPDPRVFEAAFSVDELDVDIGGTTVHSIVYKDLNSPAEYAGIPDGIPVPQIIVEVGDEIVVSLTNDLDSPCAAIACDTSIHWHGLELDNDSDGTGVTQNHLEPGDSYTYRFTTFRPGVFWFHPHMKPGAQTFGGTYGVFIVRDPNEDTLVSEGRIPPAENTRTLVLSDIEFDGDGDVGYINSGTGEAVPWMTLFTDCEGVGGCNSLGDAATPLVNGQAPGAAMPTISARSGVGIRLRLLNLSTNRYFRLSVSGGGDNTLYRIGGEGGFLEQVRVEGGLLGSWDTGIAAGELLIPASARSDVVIVPSGNDGDVITISGLEFDRGSPDPVIHEIGLAAGDLLQIVIDNSLPDEPFGIAAGNDVLGAGGIEDVKNEAVDSLQDPIPAIAGNPGSGQGSSDETIILDGISPGVTGINGIQGHFEDSGPDFTQVPFQASTRYALTGDLLELTVTRNPANGSAQNHPFHHHGFSFQPVRITDLNDINNVLYEFDYNEFMDTIDIPPDVQVVIRMRLDDRGRITDDRPEAGAPAANQRFLSGGAAGRWVFHCHLFAHAGLGMISELVVLDTDRDGDGFDTSMDCNDFEPAINPGTPEICGDGIDNNCSGFIDDGCPVADAGPDQILECATPVGTDGLLDGTGSHDPDGDPLTFQWDAAGIVFDDPASATPTGLFPLGDTTVTLTVSDGVLTDSDDVLITVEDTLPPVVDVTLDPDRLWPPNHRMVTISALVDVTDACDADPAWWLAMVSSDEADNGKGDGNTVNDIQDVELGTEDTLFQLRSERAGPGDGRTYTIEYQAEDASGNAGAGTATVDVPHNQ